MCYYHLSRFQTQVDSLHQGLSYDCSQTVGEAGVISKAVLFTQVWCLGWENSKNRLLWHHHEHVVSLCGLSSLAASGSLDFYCGSLAPKACREGQGGKEKEKRDQCCTMFYDLAVKLCSVSFPAFYSLEVSQSESLKPSHIQGKEKQTQLPHRRSIYKNLPTYFKAIAYTKPSCELKSN